MSRARPASARFSIATRTGDDGTTSLLFNQRVPKDHPQIEALGAIDELNTALGFAKATSPDAKLQAALCRVQKELVALMGEVACPETETARMAKAGFARLTPAALRRLDRGVAAIEARQPRFDGWATPGATVNAAAFDLARTAARRAERRLIGLPAHGRHLRPLVLQYLNRLSDWLWLLAREAESGAKK